MHPAMGPHSEAPLSVGGIMKENHVTEERVGSYQMSIVFAKETSESTDRWNRRATALASWLLAEWQRAVRS